MPDRRRHATSWADAGEGSRYEAGRPGYPAEVAALLADALDLGPGRPVLDLAAGTGKLTRQLAATGVPVVAAEPIAGMRAELRRHAPGVPVVAAVAEALPLRASSLQGVVAAQAVHWFTWPAAAAELRRVLRPGGGFAVVTNARDPAWPAAGAIDEVLERYEALGPRPAEVRAWREGFSASGAFEPVLDTTIAHEQRFAGPEGFAARYGSISFAILLAAEQRHEMLDQLWRAVVGAGADPLVVPLVARVEVFRPVR